MIRGKRGIELGEVLCEALDGVSDAASGELLRVASAVDLRFAAELRSRGQVLLDDLQGLVDDGQFPLQPLDADLTLDGARADVDVLCWGPVPLTVLQEQLRSRHSIDVYFLDRSQPVKEGCASCGEGGCGSCGDGKCSTGGCGSGSCSSGSTTADELTRYFAGLREQMKSAQRVSLV